MRKIYIVKNWGFKDLNSFKNDTEIYDFLNSGKKSFETLLGAIRSQDKLVKNRYDIKKKTFDISIIWFIVELMRKAEPFISILRRRKPDVIRSR